MPIGGAALDAVGVPLPEETLSVAKQSDAVLLGAIGGYFLPDICDFALSYRFFLDLLFSHSFFP